MPDVARIRYLDVAGITGDKFDTAGSKCLDYRRIVGKCHVVRSVTVSLKQNTGPEDLRRLYTAIGRAVNGLTAVTVDATYGIGKWQRRQCAYACLIGKWSQQSSDHILRGKWPRTVVNHNNIGVSTDPRKSIPYRLEAARATIYNLWRLKTMPAAQFAPQFMVVFRQYQCQCRISNLP